MAYVDGFVIALPKRRLALYKRVATQAKKIWREYGALDYYECVADDLKGPYGKRFGRGVRQKPGETIVFSWIVYRSKTDRNRINAKVMKDPRIVRMMEKDMPMDMKRFSFGGFKTMVAL